MAKIKEVIEITKEEKEILKKADDILTSITLALGEKHLNDFNYPSILDQMSITLNALTKQAKCLFFLLKTLDKQQKVCYNGAACTSLARRNIMAHSSGICQQENCINFLTLCIPNFVQFSDIDFL